MGVDVRTSVVINRPRAVVADYSGDPSNAPAWYVNIRSVEWLTEPPPRIGSRVAFVAKFLGRTLSYTYEITDFVAEECLVMRTAEGPFPMETTYAWEDTPDGGTRMSLRNRGEPAGFSRWMSPLMVPAMRRANRNDLKRLKDILESLASAETSST